MDFDSGAAIDTAQPILVTVKGEALLLPATIPRVELDLSRFHNGRWALQLDAAFARRSAPTVMLARGVACLAVAWWAQLSPRSYLAAVSGALFRSPLTIEYGQAAAAASMRLGPAQRLPFPSVVASAVSLQVEQVLALADSWGSRFFDTDAPRSGAVSNRQGPGTSAEDRLLGYLGAFDQRAPTDTDRPLVTASPLERLQPD